MKNVIKDLTQGTLAWHDWRHDKIGASESAIILGASPYKTALRLWAEKSGLVVPEDLTKNPNVARGVRLEPKARLAAEKRLNQGLLLPLCVEGIDDMAGMIASCDAVTEAGIPLEIKVPAASTLERVKTLGEQSPEVQLYQIQLQHQMMLLGASKGYLFFFDSEGGESQLFEFEKDAKMQADILAACQKFQQMVQSNTAPAADPDRDVLTLEHSNEERYLALELQKKQLEAEIASLKKEQQSIIAAHEKTLRETGFRTGKFGKVRVTLYERAGSIDYATLIQRLAPNIWEERALYAKPSTMMTKVTIEKGE